MASYLILRSGMFAQIFHTTIRPSQIRPPDSVPPPIDEPPSKSPLPSAPNAPGAGLKLHTTPPGPEAPPADLGGIWIREVTVESLSHAESLLRRFSADDSALREIRAAVVASSTGGHVWSFGDHDVIAIAAARVADGTIRLLEEVELPKPVGPRGDSATGDAASAPPPPAALPPKKKAKSWIGIELLDEDGKPVAGVDYSIKAPNGAEYDGKLDSRGRARVDDIDAGECTVTFPGLDKFSWAPQEAPP